MLLPSEIEAKSMIPAIRAILAQKLIAAVPPQRRTCRQGSWSYSGSNK